MTAFNPVASGPIAASGGANYALSVTSGTFTLSMQGAGKLITDIYPSGTFSVSGTQVDLDKSLNIDVNSGTFTLTGHTVVTSRGKGLEALSGTFAITGQPLEGQFSFSLGSTVGTFALTGTDITVIIDASYLVQSGTFTASFNDLDRLGANYDIVANAGSIAMTVHDLDRLGANYTVAADENDYTYSGNLLKFRGFFSAYVPPETWTEVA